MPACLIRSPTLCRLNPDISCSNPAITAICGWNSIHSGPGLTCWSPPSLCGPQTGGARLASLIAAQLDLPCFATERIPPDAPPDAKRGQLYQVRYRLSSTDRAAVPNLRVALVDDVINAGSATRATLEELTAHGARPVALGALLVLNDPAAQLAARYGLPLEALGQKPSHLWAPAVCPLCAQGVPLTTPR